MTSLFPVPRTTLPTPKERTSGGCFRLRDPPGDLSSSDLYSVPAFFFFFFVFFFFFFFFCPRQGLGDGTGADGGSSSTPLIYFTEWILSAFTDASPHMHLYVVGTRCCRLSHAHPSSRIGSGNFAAGAFSRLGSPADLIGLNWVVAGTPHRELEWVTNGTKKNEVASRPHHRGSLVPSGGDGQPYGHRRHRRRARAGMCARPLRGGPARSEDRVKSNSTPRSGGTCSNRRAFACRPEFLGDGRPFTATFSGASPVRDRDPGDGDAKPSVNSLSQPGPRKQKVSVRPVCSRALSGLMKARGASTAPREPHPACPTTGSAPIAGTTASDERRSPGAGHSCWPPGSCRGPSPSSTSTGPW